MRALKFIKFCCDENGKGEEEVLRAHNLIDYVLGCPELLTKFMGSLKTSGVLHNRGKYAMLQVFRIY